MNTHALDRISQLRALEALRNGVPNGDAVRALGCAQPQVLDRFRAQLEQAEHFPPVAVPGTLVSGDFGAGKSHLLEHLEQMALSRGFVCSRVVISKETPLHDTAKVVQAALREARFPGGRGSAIHELAERIDYRSLAAGLFVEWASRAPGLLAATVRLHEQSTDHALKASILDFWAGEKIAVSQVRAGLRQIGSYGHFEVKAIRIRELATLRLELATRLARAAGLKGWLLLLDEVELIGRYTLLQRAKAYAELARWLAKVEDSVPGLATVAAITDDFDIKVLQEKQDLVMIGERLRAKGTDADMLIAGRAQIGMRVIEREKLALYLPTDETLGETYQRVAELYAGAYGVAPTLDTSVTSLKRPIRSYIRRWINEWDIQRLHSGAILDTEVGEQTTGYAEDADMEAGSEAEAEA